MTPPPISPERDQLVDAAVKKFFTRLLPMLVLMLLVNQMDRTNVGFVKEHIETDIGVSSAAFGLGAGLFFVGYAIFEVPSNAILERVGARVWLTRIMITWGLVTVATAFIQDTTQFYIARFLLGACEAGFFPGVIYYFTQWLPDRHRGRANAIFLGGSATAYIVTGPISGGLIEMHGIAGIAGWRWMYLIEGGISVAVGIVAIAILRSRIEDAGWLTSAEKQALSEAVKQDAEARRTTSGEVSRWRLALTPNVALLTAVFFALGLTTYAITFWLPSLVGRIEGTNAFTVGLLSAIPWLLAVVAMYSLAKFTDKVPFRHPYLGASLLIAAVGTFLATIGSPWFGLLALCVAAVGIKCASTMFWPLVPQTLDVRVAATGIALINSLGNLAGFFGPTVMGYLEDTTGSTDIALYILSGTSLVALLGVRALWKRRQPARQLAEAGEDAAGPVHA